MQIRIRESQRHVLRFHCVSNLDLNRTEVNRFASLVFGLMQSPFILEGTLKEHCNNYKSEYPELIENIRNHMYLDDLVSGGKILSEVEVMKQKSRNCLLKMASTYISGIQNQTVITMTNLLMPKSYFQVMQVIPVSQA